jgi:hypothetical protein
MAPRLKLQASDDDAFNAGDDNAGAPDRKGEALFRRLVGPMAVAVAVCEVARGCHVQGGKLRGVCLDRRRKLEGM